MKLDQEQLIALGVAVYQVGDVYKTDGNGVAVTEADKQKWFVSVLADSPMAATVNQIPFADTENEAWTLAAHHYEQG